MSYSEWLEVIEILKKKNDQELKEKILKEEINENINSMLESKLVDLIKFKFSKATNGLIKNIHDMFSDKYMLDLYLVKFKKDIKFIEELTYLKQINIYTQEGLRESLKKETTKAKAPKEEIINLV